MKAIYLISIICIISIPIVYFSLNNKDKIDKKGVETNLKNRKEDDLEFILSKKINYKDNTPEQYVTFDETKVNSINKSVEELRSSYYRINEENKLEFIDEKTNNNTAIMKEYFNNQKEYIKNLNEFEKAALELYLGEYYKMFKNFLMKRMNPLYFDDGGNIWDDKKLRFNLIRQGEKDPRILMNKISTLLNKAILSSPVLPLPINVYRGTKSDPNFLQNLKLDKDGNYIYEIKSFMSTSIVENVPVGLNTEFIDNQTQCCMWVIHLPANTNALYIEVNRIAFGAAEEYEMLLPVGGYLKLLGYTKKYTKYNKSYDYDYDPDTKTSKSYIIKSKPFDTYEWEYVPPKNNDYNIELFYYTL